jgi:membrane protease YdiL (CAAX protease family)
MQDGRTPPHENGPGLWQAWGRVPILALILFLMASNLTAQLLVFGLVGGFALPVLAGGLFGVVLPLELLRRRGVLLPGPDLGLDRPAPVTLLLVAVTALASLAPTSLLAELSMRIHPVDPQWAALYDEQMPRGLGGMILAALAVVGVAPLVEEILFRALIQRLAARSWGRGAGLVIASLLFGLVHGEAWYLLGLIGIGLVLGIIWEATRSLTAAWLAHALHNAVSLALLWSSGGVTTEPAIYEAMDWIMLAISCAALAVTLPLLVLRRPRNPPR